jgi:hypothetical protein
MIVSTLLKWKGHSHEKVVEIIFLYHRFGPNYGTSMLFKYLKSSIKKLQLYVGMLSM